MHCIISGKNLVDGVVCTRETGAARVVVDGLSGDVKTQTAQSGANPDNEHVEDSEENLPRRREVFALVEVQPEGAAQAVYQGMLATSDRRIE